MIPQYPFSNAELSAKIQNKLGKQAEVRTPRQQQDGDPSVCTFLMISSSQGMPCNHHSPILSCREHKWRKVVLHQDRLFFPSRSGNSSASFKRVASGGRTAQPLKVSGATSEQPGHFRNVTATHFPLLTEQIWVGHPREHTD